ncbi:MAG: PorP/SprF family type IX secretion system membrane protein [Cyclobacteriaceae bacterium]|nr:PorP/SprF family type IX secretion system membrane protein [Cyclobacteriaceae bacterium]
MKIVLLKGVWMFTVLYFFSFKSFAQDQHYSQFYNAPLYLNPAFTGTSPQQRIILNNRIQWPVLPQAYTSYSLSYDLSRPALKSGFGLLLNTDKAGEAGLRSTSAGLIYSYKVQMENKWVLTPAVYFGYGSRSINYNKLVFGDQLEFGNTTAPTLDPSASEMENFSYFDSGAGLLFYNKSSWAGVSLWHINEPGISFLDRVDRLPAKLTIHAGTRIALTTHWWNKNDVSYLTTSFIYNQQGPFTQIDLAVNYHIDPIVVGVSYRGIPVKKNALGNMSRDAVVFSSGLRFNQIKFQYSYDFTVSELSVRSQGAHEVSLEYVFTTRANPKRVPKSMKFLPCPSFIPYDSYKIKKKK